MPHSEQHDISEKHAPRHKGSRTVTIILTLVLVGIFIAALAPMVLLLGGFYGAMSSFGAPPGPSQPSPIIELVGFILVGSLPLAIFLIRRAFSRRDK